MRHPFGLVATIPSREVLSRRQEWWKWRQHPHGPRNLRRRRSPRVQTCGGGRYVPVWIPYGMEPKPPGGQAAIPGVSFMKRVSVAEQGRCNQDIIDAEPLQYHCSKIVMAEGGAEWGTCVLQTVLDGGSVTAILGETCLRRLQQHIRGLPAVHEGYRRPAAGEYPPPSRQA